MGVEPDCSPQGIEPPEALNFQTEKTLASAENINDCKISYQLLLLLLRDRGNLQV